MIYDLIIIGAGAAGLFAASKAENLNVLLIEKKDRVGLKLLASGGGQCNLTHGGYISHFYNRYGKQKKFVKPALSKFDNKQTIAYFKKLGIECFERADGKVFPVVLDAGAVVKALKNNIICNPQKEIITNSPVCDIVKSGERFTVITESQLFESSNVIIATGGKSYPALGSAGEGYPLAEKLGHTIVEPQPGLTGVVSGKVSTLDWSGIGLSQTEIRHKVLDSNGGYVPKASYRGDLLFTHFGVSGPVILDNSRYLSEGDLLELNLINASAEVAENAFLEIAGDKPLAHWLNLLKLTDKFKNEFLKYFQLSGQEKVATLSKRQRKEFVKWLTQFEVKVDALQGFKQAMVTVGGVDTSEVDPKTMASKCVEGLYFVGEVLNVDGDTGGYNLQWAFSSAVSALENIENRC